MAPQPGCAEKVLVPLVAFLHMHAEAVERRLSQAHADLPIAFSLLLSAEAAETAADTTSTSVAVRYALSHEVVLGDECLNQLCTLLCAARDELSDREGTGAVRRVYGRLARVLMVGIDCGRFLAPAAGALTEG